MAAAAVAVVLVGGGAGASVALSAGTSGGASTPAQAVDNMLSAISQSDVVGFMDDLAPGERDAIAPGVQEVFGQLKRIGVLSAGADLNAITGISVRYHGYTTTTHQITSDLASVTVDGGSVDQALDPNKVPLGSYFKSLVVAATTGQVQKSTQPPGSSTLATVQVGGSWYVSLGYSTAFGMLKDAGRSTVPPPGPVEPAGASTPQGAVTAMFDAVSAMNLRSLVADLDPAEMAALDTYAPLFLDQAQKSLDQAKGQASITFDLPSLTTENIPGGTLVKIGSGFAVHAQSGSTKIEISGGCETVTTNGSTHRTCGAGGGLTSGATRQALVKAMPAPVQPILQRFADSPPDFGFVTAEVNGKWYVSPTRTLLQSVDALLAELQPGDIQTFIANAHGISKAFGRFLQHEVQAVVGSGGAPGPLAGGAGSPLSSLSGGLSVYSSGSAAPVL